MEMNGQSGDTMMLIKNSGVEAAPTAKWWLRLLVKIGLAPLAAVQSAFEQGMALGVRVGRIGGEIEILGGASIIRLPHLEDDKPLPKKPETVQ